MILNAYLSILGSLTHSKCVCSNIHLLPLTFEPASIVSIHPCLMPFHRLIIGLLHHKDPCAKAPNARTFLAPSSVYLFQCNFQSIFKWNFGEFQSNLETLMFVFKPFCVHLGCASGSSLSLKKSTLNYFHEGVISPFSFKSLP